MKPDLPTGSVTGRKGWEWNQWQSEQRSRNKATNNRAHRERSKSAEALRRDLRSLEIELERKDDRLYYVVEHYESLLADKNRQLANRGAEEPSREKLAEAFSAVLRRLPDP